MWTGNGFIAQNKAGYPHYPQVGWYVLWINRDKIVRKILKKEEKSIAK